MRLYEILKEDISVGESIKNIVDILTTELPMLYRTLSKMAENYYDNHGTIDRGFRFISGGQKSKWYHDIFFKNLKPSLYKLHKSVPPQVGAGLGDFLEYTIGEGTFSEIEGPLLNILGKVANLIKNRQLSAAVETAKSAVNKYHDLIDRLKYSDSDNGEPAARQPKQQNVVSKQNASIEGIINDALSRIDKKQAGEIRNIVAKSANKLQTLQAEFTKRGIRV